LYNVHARASATAEAAVPFRKGHGGSRCWLRARNAVKFQIDLIQTRFMQNARSRYKAFPAKRLLRSQMCVIQTRYLISFAACSNTFQHSTDQAKLSDYQAEHGSLSRLPGHRKRILFLIFSVLLPHGMRRMPSTLTGRALGLGIRNWVIPSIFRRHKAIACCYRA
jgi:hypothetical protein